MPRPTQLHDVNAQRDVILGDQHIKIDADLSRVEEKLGQIVALLRDPQSTVRVEGEANQSVIIVGAGNAVGQGNEVRFAAADMDLLGALQRARADDARCREEIYLARFILGETYARWDRYYLPLAGRLLDAPLRLADRGDPSFSAAGLALPDVREALTRFGKTRLVILGEPGAGKTTTLHRLALDLARERLRDPLKGKLPFRSDLFKYADDRLPSDFIEAEWKTSGLSESCGEMIAAGQVCWLLDGVNQMPLSDRARRVERWAHWANDELPPGNWAVFTCRTADYVTDLRLPEVRVQSLDPDRMRQYLELRFDPARAAELWREVEQRLRSGDDRFERLARNPFMLSQLADRAAEGKPLTGSRATLMDDLADRLINRELRGYGLQPDALTADPRSTLQAEMEALGRLAWAMQQARGEGTSITHAAAAQVKLGDKGQLRLSHDQALDLATDATVLEAIEGSGAAAVYAFYHHLLQEYFAARELVRQFRAGKNLARLWRVPWRAWQLFSRPLLPGERLPPPPVTGWEETLVMAAGLAGPDAPRLIAALRKDNLPLAGRCLAEAGSERADLQALVTSTRAELLKRQRSPAAHLRARIAAGLALGALGHPDLEPRPFEFEGRTVWAIVPPVQSVPAGEFIRGSDRADKRAYADEYTTERRVTLPAFSMGRYPVTNAEYRLFIEAGGYQADRWWSEAGRAWKQGGPGAHDTAIQSWMATRSLLQQRDLDQVARQLNWRPQELRYWKEITQLSDEEALERARQQFDRPFDRPALWDDADLSSQGRPVVGVNWHEAQAYCQWLSAVTGREYRLPAESEWEKAARGTPIPTPSPVQPKTLDRGREYPWGDKFDPSRCNSVESHIYTTTPVGLYPQGVSPFGLFDASGNVWEWTADWYQMYPGGEPSDDFGEKFKSVRGGSWFYVRDLSRCADRLRFVPVDWLFIIGFRLVAPGSISAS
jgi:formylglycine-generating enzyme required for sulfatase activity